MIKNFCAIVILIVAASFGIAGAASNEKILDAAVYDNAGILSAAEIRALTDKIHAVEQKHGIKIGVEFHETVIGKMRAKRSKKITVARPTAGLFL